MIKPRTLVLTPLLALGFVWPAAAGELPGKPPIEHAWVFEAEGLTPRDDFGDAFRDIDAVTLSAMRSWRHSDGLELQLGGGFFLASGVRGEPFSSEPPADSDAAGVKAGGRLRYNFPAVGPVRPFADAYAGVVWTPGSPFPAGGTAVNGQATWGGGVEVALDDRWAIETGYRQQHLSNGGGLVDYNLAFNSHGPFVGLRRRLGHD